MKLKIYLPNPKAFFDLFLLLEEDFDTLSQNTEFRFIFDDLFE